MSDPLVSIILRSFNEGWALGETLPALQAQEYRNWELLVIDSGSTDNSVELILRAQPACFIQIRHEDYNPARVLNLGMQLARAEFGIFLNADATPQGPNWLRPLVLALQDPNTAAVFGKQIPRPDCRAVFAHDYERCFGAERDSAHWEHFFSMASSGLRKDIWSRRGFLEKFQYSEDDEYTRWCRVQGYRVVYVPESVVMHSHNYTPPQAYKRSYGEARALAAVWNKSPRAFNWPLTVLGGWLNDARRDFGYCARTHRLCEWPHAARIRWQQRVAKLAGFRAGWKFYRTDDHCEQGQSAERTAGIATDESSGTEPEIRRSEIDSSGAIAPPGASNPQSRFTIDGSEALEARLAKICADVLERVRAVIPPRELEALVLGGGYGRGEGGVLKTETGEQPYNDLEFYVFVRGNRLLADRRYRSALQGLADTLSEAAGAEIEFKVDSLARLRRDAVTMFSYDLVSRHRVIWPSAHSDAVRTEEGGSAGNPVFAGCEHHLDARKIPMAEATRLLLNRCTGLLFAKELLRKRALTPEQADFIGRNLAKAELALGDAVLTAFGRYHWSCLERRERLSAIPRTGVNGDLVWLSEVQRHHAAGVEFKLHPRQIAKSADAFAFEHAAISALAMEVWLWLENRRLGRWFSSAHEYAFSSVRKCSGAPAGRNILLNTRLLGARGLRDRLAFRYPRERLLNSLPLLLWDDPGKDLNVRRYLQKLLHTAATDSSGLVAAYKNVWMQFR